MVGHEWGHTIQHQDPDLYSELRDVIANHAADFGKSASEISAFYSKPASKEIEFVNNTLGDSFMDPDFWRAVGAEVNSSLFQRLYGSIMGWFEALIQKARTTWGTERAYENLRAMRNDLAKVVAKAIKKGPYKNGKPTADAELSASIGEPFMQPRREIGATLSLLQREKATLLGKLTSSGQQTAAGQTLKGRLREIDVLIAKTQSQQNLRRPKPQSPGNHYSQRQTDPDTAVGEKEAVVASPERRGLSAALSILQQERNSLLQKLDATESRSAKGSILRERLGEINVQIDKFNNLPGNTPTHTNRKNGAALAILQQERNSLLQRLDTTDSRSAEGSILMSGSGR